MWTCRFVKYESLKNYFLLNATNQEDFFISCSQVWLSSMSRKEQRALLSGLLLEASKVLSAKRAHRILLEILTYIAFCLRKVGKFWKYTVKN